MTIESDFHSKPTEKETTVVEVGDCFFFLLWLLPQQVKQEIRSFNYSRFLTKLEKTAGLKPSFFAQALHSPGGFHWQALGQKVESFETWPVSFPSCETGTLKVGLLLVWGGSHYSKKANDCGNGFVLRMLTRCMPVNAVSHWGLTLGLTLWDIFKENRIELGIWFRLHNMMFGYYT